MKYAAGTWKDVLMESAVYFSPFHQFSQLINNQKRLGSDTFPLIDQTFYPNYRDMVRVLFLCLRTALRQYPCSAADSENVSTDDLQIYSVLNCFSEAVYLNRTLFFLNFIK